MGEIQQPPPQVYFRIAYDESAIYLFYWVREYAVRAVSKQHGDSVWQDSCVEFFFSPSDDLSEGYFNLEMNCGGTALLHYHPARKRKGVPAPDWLENAGMDYGTAQGARIHKTTAEEFQGAEIRTSLPKIVDPEWEGPLRWTLAARIPLGLLQKIHRFASPRPGTVWRANFFKCGDATSRPHWLTWAPVDRPSPAFHVPRDFGTLVFQ